MHAMIFTKPQLWQPPQADEALLHALPGKIAALAQRLQQIANAHPRIKLASSLAVEDLLLHDALAEAGIAAEVFTLETGRLNAETLALAEAVRQRYPNLPLTLYQPEGQAVTDYVREHGENAFYDSVPLRRRCCEIRKIEPLNRALANADAWLTGQRREQSVTRTALDFAEHDSARGIAKYNPIFDWSEPEVWAYIRGRNIPFNALYEQGYPSIGCEPCTMPVKAGQDIRAGRWWWESRDSKECGLHK